MATKDSAFAEKRTNVLAAVGVGFVCLVIGLPLWWKTTEVYRVSLPYTDIDSLARSKIKYTVDINVISFLDDTSKVLASLSRLLNEKLGKTIDDSLISHYRTFSREATEKEKNILYSTNSLTELDLAMTQSLNGGKSNEYYFILLPSNTNFKLDTTTFGIHRLVFIKPSTSDPAKVSSDIVPLVKTVLIRETTIIKGYSTAAGVRSLTPDKEMLRSVRFHSGYDVILTLVNPRPDIFDVQWNIETAVNKYFDPLIEMMRNYTEINVKSQMLYFTKLQTKPKKDSTGFYFTMKELPHMINPLEAKLGSPATTNPELNFIVYIPSKDQQPLYLKDEKGNSVKSNSFLSPQWGGIHIYNIDASTNNKTLPVQQNVDMSQVMNVFISQLRLLLNIHSQVSQDVQYLPLGKSSVTEWELDGWLRSKCIENIATSSTTLQSLSQLLGKISNIVINDDIGKEVEQAVLSMKESLQLLSDGFLIEAYQHSKNAVQASEKAFFDPSLLELLYFPEDQKFAIYIPLFLPISFPVLASLWQSFKWYRNLNKPKQE
ncbi:hypothetical protein ACF0H5_009282 [Mactra antiquata]